MPIGVPRIIYCWGEELPAQWTDIYNFIFRRRMVFLMQYLDDELCNQICGLLINIHMEDRTKELEKKEIERSGVFKRGPIKKDNQKGKTETSLNKMSPIRRGSIAGPGHRGGEEGENMKGIVNVGALGKGIEENRVETTKGYGQANNKKRRNMEDLLNADEDLGIEDIDTLEQYTLQKITTDWLNWNAQFFDYSDEPYLFYLAELFNNDSPNSANFSTKEPNENQSFSYHTLVSRMKRRLTQPKVAVDWSFHWSPAAKQPYVSGSRAPLRLVRRPSIVGWADRDIEKADYGRAGRDIEKPDSGRAYEPREGMDAMLPPDRNKKVHWAAMQRREQGRSALRDLKRKYTYTRKINGPSNVYAPFITHANYLAGDYNLKKFVNLHHNKQTLNAFVNKTHSFFTENSIANNTPKETPFFLKQKPKNVQLSKEKLLNMCYDYQKKMSVFPKNSIQSKEGARTPSQEKAYSGKRAASMGDTLKEQFIFRILSVLSSAPICRVRCQMPKASGIFAASYFKKLPKATRRSNKPPKSNSLPKKRRLSNINNKYRNKKIDISFSFLTVPKTQTILGLLSQRKLRRDYNLESHFVIPPTGIDPTHNKANLFKNVLSNMDTLNINKPYTRSTRSSFNQTSYLEANNATTNFRSYYRKQTERTFMEEESKKVFVIINSFGGSVGNGVTVHDALQFIKAGSLTLGLGVAASAASLVLAGGTIGERYVTEGCHTMTHQPESSIQGQASDIWIDSQEIMKIRLDVAEIYSLSTYRPRHKILRDLDRDFYLTATETIHYGLADEIATNEVMHEIIEMTSKVWDYHDSKQQRLLESRESATSGLETQPQV
uniref:ATP-dependent Clp protease proteolytic subunit n=1 Tax=Haematococcus lacustris TaxID=44745 RepID=A0A2K9YRZ0_HAELA|nr:ATP-dependent Clp protease proteolytic subunit [Haematococcus lacustris]AUW36550.1 ATP-dependent Clp protease proteolytic subunit [Haematococcus lacustris]